MSEPFTVGELREFLEDVDDDRIIYFLGSGAIHACVGANTDEVKWNNGKVEQAVVFGGRGSGVEDPREGGSDE